MYFDYTVTIPSDSTKLVFKKHANGTTYVNYEYDRVYKPDKKYTIAKRTTIGKVDPDHPDRMYPNPNFLKYFPDYEQPEVPDEVSRSHCLRIGAYIVIKKIMEEYDLGELLCNYFEEDDWRLVLDFAAYSIICENNANQYYPEYAFNHPLLTVDMKQYSDSKLSTFMNEITDDQRIGFINEWNKARDHSQKIYVSYDSTNKNCEAGDVELAEFGHAKDDTGDPIINYAVAYDTDNRVPLFYEDYPGSIVDTSQLQHTLEKFVGYGYQYIGIILDRGYFSKANIRYMDKKQYDFIIMVKGKKKLVRSLILQEKGTFEETRSCCIREYKTYGKTVTAKLYEEDEKERYFHLYYDPEKNSKEREQLEHTIDRYKKQLKKMVGRADVVLPKTMLEYFEPIYANDGVFLGAREREDVIEQELKLCGYFAIVSSANITAAEALIKYKGRDASEKLFKGDKSFLGNRAMRMHSLESEEAKIFIEFIALIVRNKIYTCLKDEKVEIDHDYNYMSVPAAIKELEKIEMIKLTDGKYRLNYAVTKTQKVILGAFDLDAGNVKKEAEKLSKLLYKLDQAGVSAAE